MKEEEIRPQAIFDEYLRLAQADSKKYFESATRKSNNCPACGELGYVVFKKDGFSYEECKVCSTLFVNPRPEIDAFNRYYQESESAEYWATTFYRATEDARRLKLWKPKARRAWDSIQEFCPTARCVVDIGGGYGVFAEEMRLLVPESFRILVVEPSPFLQAICKSKGIEVVPHFLEEVTLSDLPGGPTCFTSFELFEHIHDPKAFLTRLDQLMHPGDLFYMTTLSGIGVDIRVLWESSKSVSPPHHLNFFNPASFGMLARSIGWEVCEVSTPGKLDIDIMKNAGDAVKDRFWREFLRSATETHRDEMQSLLARAGFSSHMLAICRKQ